MLLSRLLLDTALPTAALPTATLPTALRRSSLLSSLSDQQPRNTAYCGGPYGPKDTDYLSSDTERCLAVGGTSSSGSGRSTGLRTLLGYLLNLRRRLRSGRGAEVEKTGYTEHCNHSKRDYGC